MKKGWLRRFTPLRRGRWKREKPERLEETVARVPFKRKNTREDAWRRAFGSPHRVLWVKSLPCLVPGCDERNIDNAHVKSIASGGTYRTIIPLCHAHHMEQHNAGIITFAERYGLNLARAATYTDAAYRRAFPEKAKELEAA